jgi:alkyl hydroperoxide reductase subunit F
MNYDLAIIGGGPAGVAAGVYASRKRLKTVFITKDFYGQSSVSTGIENWIGTVNIPGMDLSAQLKKHLEAYAGDIVTIREGEYCTAVSKIEGGFSITTSKGSYTARAILVTTGSARKRLQVPGADALEHKGITYCASCDGPLFADQDVAVIGGGNAAFESAAQLLAYTKSVTLLNRSTEFRADPVTVSKVLAHPKMKAITNAVLVGVQGSVMLEGLTYAIVKDGVQGPAQALPVTGIFVEIGSEPATDFVGSLVERDQWKHIKVDARTQRASVPGIWAAGDCTDGLYHQNNIAAGDGVKALEDIYLYLMAK